MTHVMNGAKRLAVYGTLAPGRVNHDQVAALRGKWAGTVRGRLLEEGWGAQMGYPGLVLDANGAEVAVQVLESADLPENWARLDEFEGEEYRRATVEVTTERGQLSACIYVVA